MEKCSGWFADTWLQPGFCTDTTNDVRIHIFYDRKAQPNRRRRTTSSL